MIIFCFLVRCSLWKQNTRNGKMFTNTITFTEEVIPSGLGWATHDDNTFRTPDPYESSIASSICILLYCKVTCKVNLKYGRIPEIDPSRKIRYLILPETKPITIDKTQRIALNKEYKLSHKFMFQVSCENCKVILFGTFTFLKHPNSNVSPEWETHK